MKPESGTTSEGLNNRARILHALEGGAVRCNAELTRAGARAAAIGRMVDRGEIERLGRGLYPLPGAEIDRSPTLLEAARRVPRGVICLVSALVFHELTDALPATVWMAIGRKDRRRRRLWPSKHQAESLAAMQADAPRRSSLHPRPLSGWPARPPPPRGDLAELQVDKGSLHRWEGLDRARHAPGAMAAGHS